jgi:RNA polymerase sigma-70 factor, ECF subfamily
MNASDWQTEEFERHRRHLRAVAYRMLGSLSDADDVLQEAWLRLNRSDAGSVENMRGWLTTVVARLSLDELRARKARREDGAGAWLPEPIVRTDDETDPEQETLLADSVGLALLVVLETLSPAERLAFVLHDMFAVPFGDIGEMVGRSPAAARQLASRARRRVQGRPAPDPDLDRQREVVDAFFAASRDGDFEALVAVLDPDVLLVADGGEARPDISRIIRGAHEVASEAFLFRSLSPYVRPALVNGAAGVVVAPEGRPFAVMGFTVVDGKIVEIDAIGDPDRLARLDLTLLDVVDG